MANLSMRQKLILARDGSAKCIVNPTSGRSISAKKANGREWGTKFKSMCKAHNIRLAGYEPRSRISRRRDLGRRRREYRPRRERPGLRQQVANRDNPRYRLLQRPTGRRRTRPPPASMSSIPPISSRSTVERRRRKRRKPKRSGRLRMVKPKGKKRSLASRAASHGAAKFSIG